MTERSNKKKYPLCAAALALAVLLAGCAPAEGTAVATAQPTAEPTEAPTPTPEPEMNPLTGEQGDYTNQRPVAVSIRTGDGSTPQWGIAAADVLIEGVTEGKTAGLTAVFASVDSVEKAGPVAPGRDLPLQLVLPLNAVPVHINKSVYASNLLNVLQYQDLDGYHAGTAGFAFDEDRTNSGYREENCWYTTKDLINTGLATYNTDAAFHLDFKQHLRLGKATLRAGVHKVVHHKGGNALALGIIFAFSLAGQHVGFIRGQGRGGFRGSLGLAAGGVGFRRNGRDLIIGFAAGNQDRTSCHNGQSAKDITFHRLGPLFCSYSWMDKILPGPKLRATYRFIVLVL